MSRASKLFCRSWAWRAFAGSVVLPWALQRNDLRGDVLEIGCGSGAMAAAILRRFPDLRLTATDFDESMIETARSCLSEFGARANLRQADATVLPFDDESFDVVVTFIMLHHVINWEQALSEARRVLRPGGRLIGYDLLGDGAGRIISGHEKGTRLMRMAELRRELDELALADTVARPALVGLAARFSARKAVP